MVSRGEFEYDKCGPVSADQSLLQISAILKIPCWRYLPKRKLHNTLTGMSWPPFIIRAHSHPRTLHDRLFSVLPTPTYTNKKSLAVSISSHVLYSELFVSRFKQILCLYWIIFIKERRFVTVNKTSLCCLHSWH